MSLNTARLGQTLGAQGRRTGSDKSFWSQVWSARWCYLFMLPSLVLAGMFSFYPTVMSWYFSFLDWSGFSSDRSWIGLGNFREIIHDPFFWDAYLRSFLFMLVGVPVKVVLALVIALILNDASLRLAPVFRTMIFLPVVTSGAIVGIVMTFVFSPFNGPINQALLQTGLVNRPVDFLGDPSTALWSVVAVWVWKSAGVTMIYWLAALQVVPQDLYEAARIDGANRWRLHRDVTLPMILPFAAVIVLISIVGALNVFGLVQTMTGGGPYFSSEVVEVYIYRTAFGTETLPRLGYASAAALFFGLTVLALSLIQGIALKKANSARAQLRTNG